MSDALLEDRDGSVVVLTINRPDTRYALSDDVCDAIEETARRLQRDVTVGAIVLTGTGSAFSAGGNVKEMYAGTGMFSGTSAEMHSGYRQGIQRIPRAMHELEIPVVAAVNGPAIGAGLDLTLMCDLRVASDRASFAESFLRLGLISGDGGAWFLPRIVGMARAAEMTLTCDAIDAQTALAWGLVSHITAPEALMTKAMELARKVAAHPVRSARFAKRLLRDSMRMDLPLALDFAAALQSIVQHTTDQKEAVAAFVEKRPPVFRGA
jgi:enoyl-CoA hydratase/carnithine racemase